MERFILALILGLSVFPSLRAQQYGWINIGNTLPDTPSTATISDIAMAGDSMWVTSGYGTYQNGVPGEIYFSADRGNTWSIQTTLYGTHAIFMKNSLEGWCGGVEGQIYHTSDGGQFWQRKFSLGRTLLDIDFPPGCDTGICTGFNGGVKYLSAGGLVSVNMYGYVSNISSVSCIDKNHAFVAGEEIIGPLVNGTFLINQSYPGTNGIYAISMIDTLTGWCVGSPTEAGAWDSAGCMIIHTTDGQNWQEQVNPVLGKTGTLMAVKALNNLEVWTVGTSGVVLHTTDGGINWIHEAAGLTNEMLYGIHVVNSNEVYVTGNNRTLLKYGLLSGSGKQQPPQVLTLYPNPAHGVVTLRVSGNARVKTVRITDLAGRVVRTFPGPDNNRIDLTGFRPGAYLLRAVVNGNEVVVKMVVAGM